MNAALLLVDAQQDFLNAPGLAPHRRTLELGLRRWLELARTAGWPVGHVRTSIDRATDGRLPHWVDRGAWSCERGTPGHAPPAALAERAGEPVFHKRGYGAAEDPAFAAWLASLGSRRLVVAGLYTHACVRIAACEAMSRGVRVVIAEDASASAEPLHAAASLRYLAERGSPSCSIGAIGAVLAGRPARLEHTAPWEPGDVLWSVEDAAPAAVDRAVDGAREAQRAWAAVPASDRAAMLGRLAGQIESSADALSEALVRHVGKPIAMAEAEVARGAALCRLAAGLSDSVVERTTASGVLVRRVPVGVVGAVTPYNNPLAIPLGKIAPALAMGNAVVWKPAPAGRMVAELAALALRGAGVPDGLVAIVDGLADGAVRIASHPGVDAVSFSGSALAGVRLHEAAAARHALFQAELGGNNAAIVGRDAALADAAERIVGAAFGFAGQRCTATRRAIVPRSMVDGFVGLLTAGARALPMGDPRDRRTVVGPLISAAKAQAVRELLESARDDCLAVIEAGSAAGGGSGTMVAPHIVVCDKPEHEVVQEETFGPVLVVQPADDFEHALALCNGVRQGLAACYFGGDDAERQRFLREARAGVVKVNRATADAAADAPFLGWKHSGLGPAEHAEGNAEFYGRWQSVY